MIIVSVEQLAGHIHALLESDPLLADVWVSGEVSNLSRPASGHSYFTLKDGVAQVRCALFKQRARKAAAGALQHGAQVLAHGYVSFYDARGDLQFYVDAVQPAGVGLLQAEFERLFERLEEEGLFSAERKRPLPRFPRRIGVVTSPSGAVFHDICQVLQRRWPLVEVVLAPTSVQGDGATDGLVAAIAALNRLRDIDVIIVARGGGSIEDLWAFNEELVARAIFGSRIPTISAVGHETDFTIADYVADLRAPTPSAAAELAVPDQLDIALRLGGWIGVLSTHVERLLGERRDGLEDAALSLRHCCPDPASWRRRVATLQTNAQRATEHALALRAERLSSSLRQLATLSPQSTLGRGYALIHDERSRPITSASGVRPGDRIGVRMHDGEFEAYAGSVPPPPRGSRAAAPDALRPRLL
jgi:exodeoxyribonuclease VII large subunit